MKFSFHPDAEAEFDQAVAYYESDKAALVLTLPMKSWWPLPEFSTIPMLDNLSQRTSGGAWPNVSPTG
jgi:hypothetical protein